MLFCFDFDDTIVDRELPRPLMQMSREEMFNYLNKPPILNKSRLSRIFHRILNERHHLALTSFSSEDLVIGTTLIRAGLSVQVIETIAIVLDLPVAPDRDKEDHIQMAKDHYHVTDNAQVVLIDDQMRNINKARECGQTGIWVNDPKNNTSYLDQIEKVLDMCLLKQPAKPMLFHSMKLRNNNVPADHVRARRPRVA